MCCNGRVLRRIVVPALLALLAGCRPATPAASAAPGKAAAAAAPRCAAPEGARPADVLAAFAKKHPLSAPDDPLRHPSTLADVDAILHLDQIDLFAPAIALARKQPGPDALVLRAQLEIAYSEAMLVVANVIEGSADGLEEVTRTLRFRAESGPTSAEEKAKREEVEATFREARSVSWALRELAADHARDGATDAQLILASKEKTYRGYRVAADYHRLRGDWDEFAADLEILARDNPTSTGLLFLRGIAAQAEGEPVTALELYRKALAKDPKFVRAQAHIVLMQTNPERAHAELARLAELNPRHQLITYAGPFIEAAHKAWSTEHRDPSRWGRTTDL